MVHERRVVVVEAQEHGFAIFLGQHEVEGVEGAPEGEGDTIAVLGCQLCCAFAFVYFVTLKVKRGNGWKDLPKAILPVALLDAQNATSHFQIPHSFPNLVQFLPAITVDLGEHFDEKLA